MQSTKILVSLFLLTGLFLTSCEDFLGPDNDNHSTPERLFRDPSFAEGLLLNGYVGWPDTYNTLEDVASDNATTNIKGNFYQRMATGEWSAMFDPMSVWNTAYNRIYYLNYFLSIVKDVDFAWDNRTSSADARDSLFKVRFTAEAKILRAWYNFELLKRHGGVASDGTPLGFIILDTMRSRSGNNNLARNSYNECVEFILTDLNDGISHLPNVYADIAGNAVYNTVFGNSSNKNKNRIDGKFGKALKSRVLTYVASMDLYTAPAKWDSAAVVSGRLLTVAGGGINGTAAMPANSLNFWRFDTNAEILFRRDYFNRNDREIANFPPSRFGNGATNPSQNLVDAFPMANGYPIGHALSGYNSTTPYVGRDPRLAAYIVYNGGDINGTVVHTNVEDTKDGLNQTVTSTRTGYYMKKLLQPAINLNPSTMSMARHFYTIFRYTEIYLNYAEAANEVGGPDADPGAIGLTPRSIIRKIRARAGIPAADPYLASIVTKEDMRVLIRNERRLELCFEGFRFWDMRRWNENLTEPLKGMSIINNTYNVIEVEQRAYEPHMKYGPIPYQEVLKSTNTLQNQGW